MDKQKVLIADDEAPIREILKIYCDKEGFDVIEAAYSNYYADGEGR